MKQSVGALVLLLSLVWPAYATESYTMDASHCIPVFEFKHLGMTTQTGRFDKVDGTFSMDRDARVGHVLFNIETASLNMGFGTETPNSPGYHLFDVARFPVMTFKSDKLVFDDSKNVVAAAGQLTMLGVTKPITVSVSRFKCSHNPMLQKMMCAGNISATVKRSEFGMMRYIPAISDEVKVSIPIEAYKD